MKWAGWLPFGALACALAAQTPPLPSVPPVQTQEGLPEPGELLPLRPAQGQTRREGTVSLQLRGRDMQETPEGRILLDGALESPGLLLLADRLVVHRASGEVEAVGNVRLEGPGVRLRCGRLRMDWKKQMGEAWDLVLELPPSWVLRSGRVAFATLKHWDFEQVELSPCPQEEPGWKAQVGRLTVDLDAYARIRNLWLWVGNVPTFYYLPWAIYPAKAERTSGLLPASFAFRGTMGASVSLPYYQVLGPSADLTVEPEWYSRQGVLWGAEGRWRPEPTHQGRVQGQVIHQRSDGENRFRFTLEELWQREDGWQLSAVLNHASDALLEADYGRGLTRLGGTPFDSAFYLGKAFPLGSLSVNASRQRTFFQPDDPFYNPGFPNSIKRQVLPSLQATLFPVPLGGFYLDGGLRLGRLTYDLELAGAGSGPVSSQYAWQRDDGFLRIQGRLGQFGPLRADLQTQGRYTWYSATLGRPLFDASTPSDGVLDPASSPFAVDAGAQGRALFSSRLQFSAPPLGRVFPDFALFGYKGELKHVLEPFFALTQNSRSRADGWVPHFDEVDSLPGVAASASGERSVELGMKQHFFGRSGPGGEFRDLLRWRVSTRFQTRPVLLGDGRVVRGWATLDNDLDLEPSETLRVSFRRSTELRESGADQSLSADWKAGDGRFSLAWFSTGINRLLVRQHGLQVGGLRRFMDDRLRLEFQASYDFRNHRFATSQAALAWVTPCVASSLRFTHLGLQVPGALSKEDRLDLVFTLRGLGDLGKFGF